MRCQFLVILVFCERLVFDQLGLDVLFPLGLPDSLGLGKTGAAILGRIRPRGRENFLVNSFVIRLGQLHIWSSIRIVIRIKVRREGVLDLEGRLANPRRIIGTLIKRCRASEEDSQDGVPCQESGVQKISARLL